MTTEAPKTLRGMALVRPERRREIASMGGRRAQLLRVAHQWTRDEARAASAKGVIARRLKRQLLDR